MKIKIFTLFSLTTILFLFSSSCKKLEGPDPKYYVDPPSNLKISTEETTVSVTWDYPEDNRIVNFVAQLSYDKNFATIAKSDTTGSNEHSAAFTNANLVTEYYVRVRAIAKDIVISSNFTTASLKLESIFQPLTRSDIKATSVVLKWNAPVTGSVTKVVLISASGSAMSPVQLKTSEIAAHSVQIDNLNSATQYTALIYDGDERKGVIVFTTRDINERITINGGTTVYETLQDAVNSAVSGDIIYLGGAKYDFSGVTVTIENKSLTFQPTLNSQTIPEITFKNFDLKGNISNFKISGLKIISTSKLNTTGNTDYNKHIIGLTYVTGNINVVIENSDLSGAESGLCFTQSVGASSAPAAVPGSGIFNISINNCLLHDFGSSGGDFIDFRSGTIDRILVKNSTVYKAARAFLRTDATAAVPSTSNVISIENSTFNEVCSGAFITVKSANASVTVNKCILSNKNSTTANTVSGTGVTLKFDGNNISGSNSTIFTSVKTSTANQTALDPGFASIAGGDFTLGNATLIAAGIGDPRWIK